MHIYIQFKIALLLGKLKTQISRMHHCRQGIAAVEFALLAPIMLALFMGSIEVSQMIIVDRKVSNVAGVVGDLVSQSEDFLTTSTLNDYFRASEYIIAPYSKTPLKQIVTCVYLDPYGNATVGWSRANNGGVAHVADASFEIPDSMANVANDTYFIVAETQYTFAPLIGYLLKNNFNLNEKFVFYPRYGEGVSIDAQSC